MGWTIYDNTPHDIRGEIHQLCTGESDTRRIFPIASEQVGDVWYVAVRAEFKDANTGRQWVAERGYTPNQDGSYVFAAVILTSVENGEWGYKDMDETCGPAVHQAPRSILALLSPTTHPFAVDWRARCRAWMKQPA